MPSKNIGKKITKVKVFKKKVTISFDDQTKLEVSPDVMSNFYIYEGKTITNKEINEIKEYSENIVLLHYAMSLLRKRHYSEWKRTIFSEYSFISFISLLVMVFPS